MKKFLFFTLVLVLVSLALYGLHQIVLKQLGHSNVALTEFVDRSYWFLLLLNFFSFLIIYITFQKAPDKAGFAFLGLSLLKLMGATAFLWFPLQNNPALKEPIVLHFMTPYIVLLIVEVTAVYQLLKNH